MKMREAEWLALEVFRSCLAKEGLIKSRVS